MDFAPSPRAAELTGLVKDFIETEVEPVEADYHREIKRRREAGQGEQWQELPVMAELQAKARERGLWNLFLPAGHEGPYAEKYGTLGGAGLSNVDYAPLAELMGRSFIAPYVFNCNAPDTGNMEVLLKYGDQAQKDRWLDPLLDGRIRSAFLMTEPGVASSDATNMELSAVVDGDEIVLNGRKWFSTGVGHPDCEVFIVMGLTDPEADRHHRHSMVLVPRDTPGVKVERMLTTMGFFDEPHGHGEVSLTDVRVPIGNFVSGPGEAFAIAQGRLGPGRVHHCMRLIGLAEKALELACQRGTDRVAFGKPLVNLGGNRERIAQARIAIESTRLLVLNAAWKLDVGGPMNAISEVSQIKVAAPRMALDIIDFAMQIHGGGGLTDDFPLAAAWTGARSLRFADGPDEVHLGLVARLELMKYGASR
ncbi:acyl-CoA dehydrogenase [Nocardioides silvaticus]|uniref:Acyl-CoA dehydrogenase n=1 Tax=Nocardioides silvaticus TaxID=2201891 RepID=A0A316TJ67_9ACTN|nr:acyl-CoA dehydrogenase family protein [Nocardioides silvaticus]PWN02384.1 acyl-CoA dehydrogenase [Nocardioides silvaticus]